MNLRDLECWRHSVIDDNEDKVNSGQFSYCQRLTTVFFAVNVSEVYFQKKYQNNPENLWGRSSFCEEPQIRYKLYDKHPQVISKFKYFQYKQCLPGCVVTNSRDKEITTEAGDGSDIKVALKNDIKCQTYDRKRQG